MQYMYNILIGKLLVFSSCGSWEHEMHSYGI